MNKETEPDWSESETLISELWKNPMLDKNERLLIADGTIAWQRKVINNLRAQIKELKEVNNA